MFLVHTVRLQTPNQLDWFLDQVAAAKARGAVRVVANSEDLFVSLKHEAENDQAEQRGVRLHPRL